MPDTYDHGFIGVCLRIDVSPCLSLGICQYQKIYTSCDEVSISVYIFQLFPYIYNTSTKPAFWLVRNPCPWAKKNKMFFCTDKPDHAAQIRLIVFSGTTVLLKVVLTAWEWSLLLTCRQLLHEVIHCVSHLCLCLVLSRVCYST